MLDDWVTVWLRPVEVFGVNEEHGYGLMDSVPVWSDCNRAVGHIFRVADLPPLEGNSDWKQEEQDKCIVIRVKKRDLPKLWSNPEHIYRPAE